MIFNFLKLTRRTLLMCFLLPMVVIWFSQLQFSSGLTIRFLVKITVIIAGAVCLRIGSRYAARRLEPFAGRLSADLGKYFRQVPDRLLSWIVPAGMIAAFLAGIAVIRWQSVSLTVDFMVKTAAIAAVAVICGRGLAYFSRRIEPYVTKLSLDSGAFLDTISVRRLPWAIAASAAGSLAMELAIIRWQGTVWEIFAFYKNFSLLSCFAGLGIGYALAKHKQIPVVAILPLTAVQMLTLIGLRNGINPPEYNCLIATPISEQLNMGIAVASSMPHFIGIYFFLAAVMLLTALAFIPFGQICGHLLERGAPLKAYSLNLAGSIAGTLAMVAASFFWTPPLIWFIPGFAVLIFLQSFDRRALLLGTMTVFVISSILIWPVTFLSEQIYTPYQLLERGGNKSGLMVIRAAGQYYQVVHDLSAASVAGSENRRHVADYYELPFRLRPEARTVAVVGAGTGNDVAAALRCGAGHVDAIEIDPAILRLGAAYHPEQPYSDNRVTCILNDARTFLRNTKKQYDLVIYGLLDSHTLLSHASSLRLDSYVYTVEGLCDARNRLTEQGVVSLSFCVLSPEMGRKIRLMMQKAFNGSPPVCIRAEYDGSVVFAQSKQGNLVLDPELLSRTGFTDVSSVYGDPNLRADISTDDWPFFYMPQRIYPVSYIWMLAMVLLVFACLYRSFIGERLRFGNSAYFFMGAGFMLIETKGITELGLLFGNTWLIIAIVITAILIMAWLANLTVMRFNFRRPFLPFVMLILSLCAGLIAAGKNGLFTGTAGQLAGLCIIICPMFFSGIVFSSLLAASKDISGALAMNLAGAMCGGLLEYNSMYFGFQFLYWLAMGTYGAAFISYIAVRRTACD